MGEAPLRLRAGELVEVRDLDDIRATLDLGGTTQHLPFMPELVKFCGQRFRVRARVERTCVDNMAKRRMEDAVWLEGVRCDGAAHDGCQMGCLAFWKEAWLKRVPEEAAVVVGPAEVTPEPWPYPLRDAASGGYLCQSTSLPTSTLPLTAWQNAMTHVKDLQYGHLGPLQLVKVLFVFATLRIFGRYGKVRPLYGTATTTPSVTLGLKPGDRVEVKSPKEIEQTLDRRGRNRGLSFTLDCVPFCGGRYEVLTRVDRFIDETTGAMRSPQNTVILRNVKCPGTFRRACPRDTYVIWREAWLRRVPDDPSPSEGHGGTP
jgi:hypothetical protein